MPDTIPMDDWLRVIDAEYLRTFVKEGGSSVKFAVSSKERRSDLADRLETLSGASGYTFMQMDAASLRAYMPQDIFFSLAGQVDWRALARRAILQEAVRIGHLVDGMDPDAPDNIYDAIADAGGLEREFVIAPIFRGIQNRVYKNSRMVRDFRVAMSSLCVQENTYLDGEYYGQALLNWLTGMETRITPLRPFAIHTPINRTTARAFIESALYWIRYVTDAGTVILLDNSRVTVPRNPRDGKRYYTKTMTVEHYELLREFIDGVDRLTSSLIVVATDPAFLAVGARSRGYGIYAALRTRVMNDVRDRNLVNPTASLVQLS